jgi:hypothetical protein
VIMSAVDCMEQSLLAMRITLHACLKAKLLISCWDLEDHGVQKMR